MVSLSRSTRSFVVSVLLVLPFLALGASSSSISANPVAISADFVNNNVDRVLDLSNPSIVREQTTLIVQGAKKGGSDDYVFAIPSDVADVSLALLEVAETKGKKDIGEKLQLSKDQYDVKRAAQYYKVKLPRVLKEGDTIQLGIWAAFTHLVRPYPKEVSQKEKQLLEFLGNAYFWSPYHSKQQKTIVRLPNDDVISFKEKPAPVSKAGNVITYGSYADVGPFSHAELYAHYQEPKAILVAKKFEKRMEISHWGGNLGVQEDYELHHEGAKLKGHFSRVDFTFSQWTHHQTNVVKDLVITLPPDAKHVFYRDTIGNVSTSNFRNERQRSILHIKPRYPLYGGWRYTWHHGYNVPITSFLKKDLKSGQFVFSAPFVGGLSNVTIERAVVSIVLPEGAQNYKIHTPFPMDRTSEYTTFTYLDTTGRPTIVLEKQNVVDEHAASFFITYDYASYRYFQKPVAVTGAVLGLFFLAAVYSRLDLSITKDPKAERDALLRLYRQTVRTIANGEPRLISKMTSVFQSLKAEKRLAEYSEATSEIEEELKAGWQRLTTVAKQAEGGDVKFASDIRKLHDLQQERLRKVRAMHAEVVSLAKGSGTVDGQKRKELTATLGRYEEELEELSQQIEGLLEEKFTD
ncbi:dolichyl-diphosphooligosaccharide---protein glycotransferase [Spizellomyces sp. 'palustris']|nr:dolichyl-diphosphooligosaccharide---protein glycotransferase [Spizellomyces sp. 'palustris']